MKQCIKIFLKYVLIFVMIVALLLGMLVATAKIPRASIEQNLKESLPFFKNHRGIESLKSNRDYTYLHFYADSILLNMIYCIDSNKPLESILWSKYYETIYADINDDFIAAVEQKKEPNQEYIRYWHGSMIILRPLLTIFNIEQIYLINKIALYGLAIALLILLFIKGKPLAVVYLIAMIMVAFPVVPLCLEFTSTFYIMLITSIIAICIEKKGDKGLFTLFFITGILTCYFDFLTTEIITILVPILLVLAIRKKEDRLTSFKHGFIFLLKACALWGIAYIAMWFAKWLLASTILNVNAIKEYVKDRAMIRVNGTQGFLKLEQIYSGAIPRNFCNLFPLNLVKRKDLWKIGVTFIIIVILFFDWKNIKKKCFSALLLLIALTPYARYLVLANHSYRHAFFTFRDQIITIISLLLIILDCLNYKLLFKEIKIRRKNRKNV